MLQEPGFAHKDALLLQREIDAIGAWMVSIDGTAALQDDFAAWAQAHWPDADPEEALAA